MSENQEHLVGYLAQGDNIEVVWDKVFVIIRVPSDQVSAEIRIEPGDAEWVAESLKQAAEEWKRQS